MALSDWLPAARRRRAEQARARQLYRTTAAREVAADGTVGDAVALATRLARHRHENHFAQRMARAFEEDRRRR